MEGSLLEHQFLVRQLELERVCVCVCVCGCIPVYVYTYAYMHTYLAIYIKSHFALIMLSLQKWGN